MPHTHDDLAHLGAEVLAAVLRHRGPTNASPAAIAGWIDEQLDRLARRNVEANGVEVVDVSGEGPVGGAAN